jgi:hypothetical protein
MRDKIALSAGDSAVTASAGDSAVTAKEQNIQQFFLFSYSFNFPLFQN